jgi:hypothetical protein
MHLHENNSLCPENLSLIQDLISEMQWRVGECVNWKRPVFVFSG